MDQKYTHDGLGQTEHHQWEGGGSDSHRGGRCCCRFICRSNRGAAAACCFRAGANARVAECLPSASRVVSLKPGIPIRFPEWQTASHICVQLCEFEFIQFVKYVGFISFEYVVPSWILPKLSFEFTKIRTKNDELSWAETMKQLYYKWVHLTSAKSRIVTNT